MLELLAQLAPPPDPNDPRWRELRDAIRSGGLEDKAGHDALAFVVGLGIGLAVLIAGIAIIRQIHLQRLHSHPLRTFRLVASNLGLTLSDQWLLVRVAGRSKLKSPITLLLSPTTFTHHASVFVTPLTGAKRERVQHSLDDLRRRVFES